jgi:hypothetical protein
MWTYSSRFFAFLWSSALIFSGLGTYYGDGTIVLTWPYLVSIIAGVCLLFFPSSLFVLRMSALSYGISFVAQMPATPNHRCILFYVALAVAWKSLKGKNVEEVAAGVKGTLRWLTIAVYAFATLAKLNTAYLNPDVSCASVFSLQTFDIYGMPNLLGSRAGSVIALVSLITEALIPMLLLWPRTRAVGVLVGVLFHILLSLNLVRYFGNFSAVMFLLLIVWLPEHSFTWVRNVRSTFAQSAIHVWTASLILLTISSLTALVGPVEYALARHVLYLLFGSSLLIVALIALSRIRFGEGVGRPIEAILALALLNAVTPYLGIKNRAALTMYSNLRIEPGYSNHILMPPSADPLGYFSDTVEITATTDPGLEQRIRDASGQMTYLGLCAYLACQDDLCRSTSRAGAISYRRGSRLLEHDISDPIPADCPSWLARKLLFFGPVGPNSERACVW